MALPKWTDERTQSLTDFVGSESPISQGTVAKQPNTWKHQPVQSQAN